MATKAAKSSNKKSTVTKPKATTSNIESTGENTSVASTYKSICKTVKSTPIIGMLVAEFVGTFLLTAAFLEMQSSPLFVAFALAGVVLIVGGVSGAHVNPAMTIGAWVTRKISLLRAVGYIIVQLLGAGVAFLVLNAFVKNASAATTTTTSLFHAGTIVNGKEWYLFFAELLGTTILGLGVASSLRIKRNKTAAAFVAGFAILIALYIAMSLSTTLLTESSTALTFLNPALAFAANGLAFKMPAIGIFIIAPVIGGIIGFALQDFLHYSSNDDRECDCCKLK